MVYLKIALLFSIWWFLWYAYNFILLPKKRSTEATPYLLGCIFIISSLTCLYIAFGPNMLISLPGLAFVIALSFVLTLVNKRETGRLLNSLFQITWLYSFTSFTGGNFWLLGLIFFAGHLPLFVVKHVGMPGKLLVLSFSFFGGFAIAFMLVTLPYPFSIFAGIGLHYFTYMLVRPYDQKYKMNLIN